MSRLYEPLEKRLAERRRAGLYRQLNTADSPQAPMMQVDGRRLLSFCSNDYLGLASHPKIAEAMIEGVRRYGVGSGAAHLVNGHFRAHEQLEQALAEWTGRERALLFSTGYMANLAVLTTLAGRHDQIFQDRWNHASLIDAGQLSGAQVFRYRHADMMHLTERLTQASSKRRGEVLIVTDGVFSMDGDIAPLPALADIARQHQAWLVVDDAHGLGVIGPQGRGSLAMYGLDATAVPVLIGTLGKAFGTAGAFVAGSETLIESLIQFARPYIYTTAQPPAIAAATLAALDIIRQGDHLRARLAQRIRQFREGAQALGLELMPSATAIQPILLGDERRALAWSSQLADLGLWVPAIRPPTVPAGTARLRITLSAAHSEQHIERLLNGLQKCQTALRGNKP